MNETRPVMPDPFAPLTPAEMEAQPRKSAKRSNKGDTWKPMMPAPGEPPELARRHRRHGAPSRCWTYRDAAGAVLFAVCRFDLAGGKEVLPLCYGTLNSRTSWHWKGPAEPRPLYGLDRLAARPDAPVLLTEGEKSADAAATQFPDFVPIASQGGAQAAAKADWSALRARDVIIWPDHDEAGARYARDAAALIVKAGAATVRIVAVPAGSPEGWDLADPLPEGVSAVMLRELLDAAADPMMLGGAKLPKGFRFDARGLWFDRPPTDRDPEPPPLFIAAPFEIVGETRDDSSEAWGVLLRWRDRDGRRHEWAIPRRLVHDQGNTIAAELEDAGLECGSDNQAHNLLKRFIGGVHSSRRLRCVSRTGWHMIEGRPVFVLSGGEAFGQGAADVILQSEHAGADAAFRGVGTLPEWQREIAAYAVGNDRVALSICSAFTSPVLDLMHAPSGGMHLVGKSQSGKTTLLRTAASVWGRADETGQVRTWRATANGLEGTAAECSDTALYLDEIGQAEAREAAESTYMLANQSGKARASRAGTARRRQTWRVWFLSTGEVGLAVKLNEIGRRPMAGQTVRLLDVPADAGAGMGVFQTLHDKPSAAELVEHLRIATCTYYGTASRAFLGRLAQDRAARADELRKTLTALCDRFLAEYLPVSASGQVRSVAVRFALMAAAGELARDYGVLPWPEGEALRAAGACFKAWLAERGGVGPAEDAGALAQVRLFIEQHGESRFTLIGQNEAPPEGSRTINRAGWRRRIPPADGGEGWEYLILPEVWRTEVCKGIDPKGLLINNWVLIPALA